MSDRWTRGPRHGLRVARALLGSQYATMLEYRAEIALWALSGVLPLIMLAVWSQAGAAAADGLDAGQLDRYFVAAFLVRQFTVVWVTYSFEEDQLHGRLSPWLLQPLQPLWRYVAAHVAEQATRLPFVLLFVGVIALVHPSALWMPSPSRLLLGVLATWLAFAVNFLLQSLITMGCFWTERASALDRLLFIPYLFLSGISAPLETFPEGVRRFALATPFPYLLHFPARVLAGEPVELLQGFGALLGWAAVLLPLVLGLWRLGVRRYGALGA
jgi:ABC-2 type transport system permease protein